jgi:hypothetical protein
VDDEAAAAVAFSALRMLISSFMTHENAMPIWLFILLELDEDIVYVCQESGNELIWELLELKPWRIFIGWWRMKFDFLGISQFFSSNGKTND